MNQETYHEFKVEIDKNNRVIARWTHKFTKEDPVNWIPPDSFLEKRKEQIEVLIKLLNNVKDEGLMRVTGELLSEMIFQDDVKSLFRRAIRQAKDEKSSLRLILDIHKDALCFSLPLEFIFYDDKLCPFLAAQHSIISFSRYPFGLGRQDFAPIEPPFRVLAIISRPEYSEGDGQTDNPVEVLAKPVIEGIEKLGDKESDYYRAGKPNLDVKILGKVEDFEQQDSEIITYLDEQATLENLRNLENLVGDWTPHVVHFMGHGRFKDGKGELCLVKKNPPHGEQWISSDKIANILHEKWGHTLRLVIVQACWGLGVGTQQAIIKSTVGELVGREIPAVIGMQFAIVNEWANTFASNFYDSLREGKDLDTAVSYCRWSILNLMVDREAYDLDFGAPVLFTYNPECLKFPKEAGQAKSGQPEVFSERRGGVGIIANTKPIEGICEYIEKAIGYLSSEDKRIYVKIDLGKAELEYALQDLKFHEGSRELEKQQLSDALKDLTKLNDHNFQREVLRVIERLERTLRCFRGIQASFTVRQRTEVGESSTRWTDKPRAPIAKSTIKP